MMAKNGGLTPAAGITKEIMHDFERAIAPMNPQQRAFMKYYIKTGQKTASAVKAGYAKSSAFVTANNILKSQTALDALTTIYHPATIIGDSDIMSIRQAMELLTRIATGEEKETVVVATETGAQSVKKEADIRTRIQAIKEIIKNQPNTTDELKNVQIKKLKAETELLQKKIELANNTNTNNDLTIELDNEPTK